MGEPIIRTAKVSDSSDSWWLELPYPLDDVRVYSSVRPIGFRFRPFAFNISAKLNGAEILVTGEANSNELAITKAVAELVERCELINFANKTQKVNTSNGWAAHSDPRFAHYNAIRELVERDSVLKHWYSQTPFKVLTCDSLPLKLKSWVHRELSQSEFPQLRVLVSELGLGPSVSAILSNCDGFGVAGHCSKESLEESIEGAIEEACRMAHHFLRRTYESDTFILSKNERIKVNPGAHGVYYAHQEPFPRWIFGDEIDFLNASQLWSVQNNQLRINEGLFKTNLVLNSILNVVQATSNSTVELTWGIESYEEIAEKIRGKIRQDIMKNGINTKPHIVS